MERLCPPIRLTQNADADLETIGRKCRRNNHQLLGAAAIAKLGKDKKDLHEPLHSFGFGS
jgi:hypothetical protein